MCFALATQHSTVSCTKWLWSTWNVAGGTEELTPTLYPLLLQPHLASSCHTGQHRLSLTPHMVGSHGHRSCVKAENSESLWTGDGTTQANKNKQSPGEAAKASSLCVRWEQTH